jgi:FAD/FMN-containing dehydrogenase
MTTTQATNDLLKLSEIVGTNHVLTAASDVESYATDWRGNYRGTPLAVVRPANTVEVAAVVKYCNAHRIAIVPQAGNTGLVGGSVPDQSGQQIVLSVARLNQVHSVDLHNNTITVGAGVILQTLQEKASEQDRLFPVSLAAEGSCQVGGIIATNAGGVQVLKYGNTREQVLGVEAVLPNGDVFEGLRGLRKDNTGYDLKHLLVGSEGTLGIITAATLKLWAKPRSQQTLLLALPTLPAAVEALQIVRDACGDRVTAFEVFSRWCLELAIELVANIADPMQSPSPWYALIELSDSTDEAALAALAEQAFGALFERGLVTDGVIAQNQTQAAALWNIREHIPEAEKLYGKAVKHDISVPISAIPQFVDEAEAALAAQFPAARVVNFGHLGDGNLHFNVAGKSREDCAAVFAQAKSVNAVVYDLVSKHQGSISAEHGLGQLKRETITHYKSSVEIAAMRAIKAALDPNGIMNPGKVI